MTHLLKTERARTNIVPTECLKQVHNHSKPGLKSGLKLGRKLDSLLSLNFGLNQVNKTGQNQAYI